MKKKIIRIISFVIILFVGGFVAGGSVGKLYDNNKKKEESVKANNSNVLQLRLKNVYDIKNTGNAIHEVLNKSGTKVAYLTFDDGPSRKITPQILDILKKYNVNATFFVMGKMVKRNPDLLKREVLEGHAIGNHSFTHEYNEVYGDGQKFISEFRRTNEAIKSVIPTYDCKLIRFPGGSYGSKLNKYKRIAKAEGYSFIDWNCLTGDAEGMEVPPDKLFKEFIDTARGKDNLVILMHDAPLKDTTVTVLPKVIDYLISKGYEFKVLTKNS